MGTQLQPSQLNSPGKDIESYLASVHSIPILSKEEEQELALKLYEEDDLDAARQLVIHHLRKLFFNLRGKKKSLEWLTKEEAENIAKDLNVEVKDVLHMENRLSSNDASFDTPVPSGDDDEMMSPSQYIEDKTYDPEVIVANAEADDMNQSELIEALKMLDDRSKDILQRRYLAEDKATLHELAEEYDVSAERIRQIENGALKKLKSIMQSAA